MTRFIIQLVAAGVIVLVLAGAAVYWMLFRILDVSLTNSFASINLERLMDSMTVDEQGYHFDPELLARIKERAGFLQCLDESGKVVYSYNTPANVPQAYSPGEYIDYYTNKKPFPYILYDWIREKNGNTYTLVFGLPNPSGPLLHNVLLDVEKKAFDGKVVLSEPIAEQLMASRAYVQLLDRNGREVASFNRPAEAPDHYTLPDLSIRIQYFERYGLYTRSSFDQTSGLTWVVSVPIQGVKQPTEHMLPPDMISIILTGTAVLLTSVIALFLLLSLWNAHWFGSPMLHMMTWLNSLGKGKFEEPTDRSGLPLSRTRSGSWRRRFKVFSGVMQSMSTLSDTLMENEKLRRQIDELREEWIAGVTHDLKTPLSSIRGYAHLLAANQYDWSATETRQFAVTILDKSDHMEQLLSDLEMTYRLRTGHKPPLSEKIEMNGWLRKALAGAADNPAYGENRVVFVPSEKQIIAHIYPPWFQRIVDNLTANAFIHNPLHTILTVTLTGAMGEDTGMIIRFQDNGIGMDEKTASRLFERYYRGTDTDSLSAGTGLGMAVAKELVNAMGGRIEVDTSPGKGTSISLIWSQKKKE